MKTTYHKSHAKVGVYVDAANISRNGGSRLQYDVLREFACRDHAEALRLNVYLAYDEERAEANPAYRDKARAYQAALREVGYKVIEKRVRWFQDEAGNRYGKANADLDMAVDVLLQSENLDRVLLVTGDGDFVQVVRALQNKGCRVEVLAFDNVSEELRREADLYLSGYLVPGLLPTRGDDYNSPVWGELGSRVRGYCYHHDDNKNYGFMRFLVKLSPYLWKTDSRDPDSPYRTAFFHDSSLPDNFNVMRLPSRNHIFEFTLAEPNGKQPVATDIVLVHPS
ncbi:MAG TPA: NYN domain-containing protein [Candidatus Competibacteraceae bacterium]|nr:NYN domain-containing protein [Candidatus Competibacteraceae bacterium]